MGELQFVLGSSGSGKTEYIERFIVNESINNPDLDYLFLVPEQSSMSIQSKLTKLHKNHGFFNIEVFGFNRLAYSVFDELNVKVSGILDDYGKSMLIRKIAGDLKNEFSYFGGSVDKSGFVDQVKSFLSELYQYDVEKEKLREVTDIIRKDGYDMLANKLSDIMKIFDRFEKYLTDNELIVAEQTTELLVRKIGLSRKLDNTVVIMDGFTGFTPIQLNVLRKMMPKVKKTYALFTIDRENNEKIELKEHALFSLSKKSVNSLKAIALDEHINILPPIYPEDFMEDIHKRWSRKEFEFLEKNIFRFPYNRYQADEVNSISISSFENSIKEMEAVAGTIRYLVNEQGYRYKDIAVISGELENTSRLADRIFPRYDIVHFNDCKVAVKNNPIIDGLLALLDVIENNMSYESMFAFLKSGIINDDVILEEVIEKLENYILKHGIAGSRIWNSEWPSGEIEDARALIMKYIFDIYEKIANKKVKVSEYISCLDSFMNHEELAIEERLSERLYEALQSIFDKLDTIIGDEILDVHEFKQILELGLKDLELGAVPSNIDMVTVGDITRSRLSEPKIVFVVGVNQGIIPKVNERKQIVSAREKSLIVDRGIELAPDDATNDFYEQFYLYLNLTKPSEKLYMSYTTASNGDNGVLEPSYIISRIKNIFPDIKVKKGFFEEGILNGHALSRNTGIVRLASLMKKVVRMEEDDTLFDDVEYEACNREIAAILSYYEKNGSVDLVDKIYDAWVYSNVPKNLDREVIEEYKEKILKTSASQLETYAGCEYMYFLRYTLGLKERDIKGTNPVSFGSLIHDALQNIYVDLSRRNKAHLTNFEWGDVNSIKYEDKEGFQSDIDKLVHDAVDKAYYENYSGFKAEDKFLFMKNNANRVLAKSLKKLFDNVDGDGFVPTYFEYQYGRNIKIDEEHVVTVSGKIDRADIKQEEVDGEIYNHIRVIDYKTGSKGFELSELYEGVSLQLVMYVQALKEDIEKKKHVKVDCEGTYYCSVSDPWKTAVSREKAEELKDDSKFKMDGIDKYDKVMGSNMDVILSYGDYKIREMSKNILSGSIKKNPIKESEDDFRCNYCSHRDVCRFDEAFGGNTSRRKTYPSKKEAQEEIIEAMKEVKNAVNEESTVNG